VGAEGIDGDFDERQAPRRRVEFARFEQRAVFLGKQLGELGNGATAESLRGCRDRDGGPSGHNRPAGKEVQVHVLSPGGHSTVAKRARGRGGGNGKLGWPMVQVPAQRTGSSAGRRSRGEPWIGRQ